MIYLITRVQSISILCTLPLLLMFALRSRLA